MMKYYVSQPAKKMNCIHTSIYRLIFIISLGIVNMSYAVDPITKYQEYSGNVDYVVTAGTFRDQANHPTLNAPASSLRATAPGDLSIPAGSTIQHAFLYWGGSGSTPDPTVTFDGQTINATRNFVDDGLSGEEYFGHFADVTTLVQGQTSGTTKTYIMQNLTVDNGGFYFSYDETEAVWSLVVIYSNPSITQEHTIYVYDGWEMLWNSGGTGSPVPSNNRTFNITGINVGALGSADITTMIYEGDAGITGNESIAVNGNNLASGNIHATTSNISGVGGSFPSYGLDVDRYDASAYVSSGDNSLDFTISTGVDMIHISTVVIRVNIEIIDPCDPVASGNLDTDGDNVSDICDLDDDNDGIPDSAEQCGSPAILAWTVTDIDNDPSNIVTSLAGNPVIIHAEVISSTTAIPSFGGDSHDYSGSVSADAGTALNGNVQLSLYQDDPSGTQTKVTFNITPSDFGEINVFISDAEITDFIVYAEDASANRLSTANWDVTSYEQNGTTPASDINPYTVNTTDISFIPPPSIAQNDDAMRVRFDTQTLSIATKIVVETTKLVGGSGDTVEFMLTTTCPNNDTDGDLIPDYLDFDSDNDGIPDNIEAQPTVGYLLPSSTVNTSGAYIGLWDNYGTGITPEDTDNDGTSDFLDSDSDNDGIFDIQENGMADGLIGTDTDSDGLDNNFEGGNLNDPLDVNDEIDNPLSSILPDSDFDLGTGGDLDYRDSFCRNRFRRRWYK